VCVLDWFSISLLGCQVQLKDCEINNRPTPRLSRQVLILEAQNSTQWFLTTIAPLKIPVYSP